MFRVARSTVYWGAVASVWIGLALAVLVAAFSWTLPDPLVAGLHDRPANVTIVGADGKVIAERGVRSSTYARLDRLPEHVPQAVIATEDRRFYYHPGIDPIGLARAMVINARAGRIVQGGSTISQQLAKNLFLKPDRTLTRKFQEMVLAFWLEWKFTKPQILELYLNRVYFGSGTYGIEAAARRYFSKSAREVTLAEAALLAGLLKAPSRFAPTRNPGLAEERASTVLAAMVDAGMISQKAGLRAMASPARAHSPGHVKGHEYAVDWVLELLPAYVGDLQEDVIVETTLDPALQKIAQTAVSRLMDREGRKMGAGEAAAVMLSPSGAVRALIGGRSYKRSQFNRAVKALRQPGSAFKPFVYLAAIEAGLTPDSIAVDQPVSIRGWKPENYKRKYLGRIRLRTALARSINTVAVRLATNVGTGRVARAAHRLGITSPLHRQPSMALGTGEVTLLELTGAYVPFANGGRSALPHVIRSVRSRSGKTLFKRTGSGAGKILSARAVGAMNNMMQETLLSGTGRAARLNGISAAGKTGTSQGFRDALFVGYTSRYALGVWVGNDDSTPTKKVTGGGLPARIWKAIMTSAHEDRPTSPLPGRYIGNNRLTSDGVEPSAPRGGSDLPWNSGEPRPKFTLSDSRG